MSEYWADEQFASPWPPQIDDLSDAIEDAPDAPGNYVLRGEAWLACGEIARARADFEAALSRAVDALQASEWGYLVQAYYDRAAAGLQRCGGLLND